VDRQNRVVAPDCTISQEARAASGNRQPDACQTFKKLPRWPRNRGIVKTVPAACVNSPFE